MSDLKPCQETTGGFVVKLEDIAKYMPKCTTCDALRAELDDIKASHRAIMGETCPSDERHCSCVPFLRRELETARTENHWNRMKTAEKREDGLRDELKQLRSKAVEMVSEIQSELDAANRRIAELEADNAALTAERDHARQDAASVRMQIAEIQRPFTITVEVPELLNGECNMGCPFSGKYIQRCGMKWDVSGEDRPGPGCPRFQKPEN